MTQLRISLEGLNDSMREEAIQSLVAESDEVLCRRYLNNPDYSLSSGELFFKDAPTVTIGREWRVVQGKWWGVSIKVFPDNQDWRGAQVVLEGFVPVLEGRFRFLDRFEFHDQPWIARLMVGHVLFSLLIIPGLALLPFFALYRLSLLRFYPEVHLLAKEIEERWKSESARWPTPVPLARKTTPLALYSALSALAVSVTVGLIYGAYHTDGNLSLWLGVASGIAVLTALLMIIAAGLAFFGFMKEV